MDSQPVECYSGSSYPDRPVALWWDGRRYEIEAIDTRWRTPDGFGFRVHTPEEQAFELFYNETEDAWRVTAI